MQQGQSTPQRLNAPTPSVPTLTSLDKLSATRKALASIGVEPGVFDKARDKAKLGHDSGSASLVWDHVADSLGKQINSSLQAFCDE